MSNTVYERYAEVSLSVEGSIFNTPQYVTDLDGKQYNLSEKPLEKLKAAEKSMNYWKRERINGSPIADIFYNKFNHLYTQIVLYIENKSAVVSKL